MVNKLTEMLAPLNQNTYIFIISSFFVYLLGGMDDTLLTLMVLNALDLVMNLFSTHKSRISTKIRMYVYIMLSVIIDKLVNFDVQLRQYVILCCSYNEISGILTKLAEDSNIKIPTKIKKLLKTVDNQLK